MKKAGFYLVAAIVILAGLLIGTLNSMAVQLDLLWVQFELPLGLAVLLGFSTGLVVGLLMLYLYRVLPMNVQLRKARTALAKQDNQQIKLNDD